MLFAFFLDISHHMVDRKIPIGEPANRVKDSLFHSSPNYYFYSRHFHYFFQGCIIRLGFQALASIFSHLNLPSLNLFPLLVQRSTICFPIMHATVKGPAMGYETTLDAHIWYICQEGYWKTVLRSMH